MRVFVRRVVRTPRTLFRLVADRFITPLWLRVLGVRVGRRCRFFGLPLITMAPHASITLGDGVVIRSRHDSNPAGIAHPTILAALDAHSAILVGAGTGISGASIVARRGVTIGDRVLIGAGACVWDTDFHPVDPEQRRRHQTRDAASAPVHIGDEAFVGARSLVLKGVTIGPRAVIGAGAVVTKDVAADTIVGGNPARVLGSVRAPVDGANVR
jgi:acetyltransferase-like isoleucine patch superfamily enzyme